jgi:hypothetical protein
MEWRSSFGGEVPLERVRATKRNRERESQSVGKKGEMASEGNFGGEGVIKRTSEQVGRAD